MVAGAIAVGKKLGLVSSARSCGGMEVWVRLASVLMGGSYPRKAANKAIAGGMLLSWPAVAACRPAFTRAFINAADRVE